MKRFFLGRSVNDGPPLVRMPISGVDALSPFEPKNFLIHEGLDNPVPLVSGQQRVFARSTADVPINYSGNVPPFLFYFARFSQSSSEYIMPGFDIAAYNKTPNDFTQLRFRNDTSLSLIFFYYVYDEPFV